MQGAVGQALLFIKGEKFFEYHGLVLALLWFFAAPTAILLRKVSKQVHAACFFLIDVTTIFFILGAGIRVYPYIDKFSTWSPIKQGHTVGGKIKIYLGCLFLGLLILQHLGGVITLLKGIRSNPIHRKFGTIVSNLGRVLATFGLILAEQDQKLIIGAAVLGFILLIVSVKSGFRSD